MYRGLFDENHFIAPLDLIELKKKKLLPTGYYDSDILCEDCDNKILGNLESYASIVIWGGKGNPDNYPKYEGKINQLNQKFLHVTNIDYTKFKLFLLSIIWKASISKNKIFNSVSLGDHEESIRKMIIENNPSSNEDYQVGMFLLTKNNRRPTKLIANPICIKKDKCLIYHFLINGLIFNYKIQGETDKELYDQISIKENNTLDVFIFNEKDSIEYLDTYLKKKLRYK